MTAGEEKSHEEAPGKAPPLRRVRFPYTRIPIGVIGVLLSMWLWVGDSWRFDVTPKEIVDGSPGWRWKGGWNGRYVRLLSATTRTHSVMVLEEELPEELLEDRGLRTEEAECVGRVRPATGLHGPTFVVDTTRGRWTGKSVIAVFVFLWGVGIIVSSVWVWRKRRAAGPGGGQEKNNVSGTAAT